METILVIDDSIFCRELVAQALRHEGYNVLLAASGQEGLALLANHAVGLIILDNGMPQMDGLTFLRQLRSQPQWHDLPVIMLTDNSEKENIVIARHLGAAEYLLKASFSANLMLARVRKWLLREAVSKPDPAATPSPAASVPLAAPSSPGPRVTRAAIEAGLCDMAQIKTLGGIVSRAITFANSAQSSLHDLAQLIQQDPVMVARVFQTAHSAAFAGAHTRVSTLEEAIRNIGIAELRSVIMSAGIIQVFPRDAANGADLLHCWQHSLTVAFLMNKLLENAADVRPGVGHLVGLCHDLPEIFLRQCFPDAYQAACKSAAAAHMPAHRMFPEVFGITHGDLAAEMMKHSQLPVEIARPIEEHASRSTSRSTDSVVIRALRCADLQAHGLLLASSADTLIAPLGTDECRGLKPCYMPADVQRLRLDVLTKFATLAQISTQEDEALMRPLLAPTGKRVWYVRHHDLAANDPVACALGLLSQLELTDDLKDGEKKLSGTDMVILACPSAAVALPMIAQIQQIAVKMRVTRPTLLLIPRTAHIQPNIGNVEVLAFPVLLNDLYRFMAQPQAKLQTNPQAA